MSSIDFEFLSLKVLITTWSYTFMCKKFMIAVLHPSYFHGFSSNRHQYSLDKGLDANWFFMLIISICSHCWRPRNFFFLYALQTSRAFNGFSSYWHQLFIGPRSKPSILLLHVAATRGVSLIVLCVLQTFSFVFHSFMLTSSNRWIKSKPQIFFVTNWFSLWSTGGRFFLVSILYPKDFNRFSSLGHCKNPCHSRIMLGSADNGTRNF